VIFHSYVKVYKRVFSMYSPCISHLHGQKNHPWPPLKSQRDPMRTPDPRKLRQGFSVQFLPRLYLLVLNFRRVAGWVAGVAGMIITSYISY
jgi:hypothetical protein